MFLLFNNITVSRFVLRSEVVFIDLNNLLAELEARTRVAGSGGRPISDLSDLDWLGGSLVCHVFKLGLLLPFVCHAPHLLESL